MKAEIHKFVKFMVISIPIGFISYFIIICMVYSLLCEKRNAETLLECCAIIIGGFVGFLIFATLFGGTVFGITELIS